MSVAYESPQLENGFTRIANELLDAILQFGFSKRQMVIVFAIIRKTYGYNKRSDLMTNGQLARATDMQRQHVVATLKELHRINAIHIEKSAQVVRGGQVNRIGINKQYQTWQKIDRRQNRTRTKTGLVPKKAATSPKTVRPLVPKKDPQKTTPKDNPKDSPPSPPADLPQTIDAALWTDFASHRKAIGKPMTAEAVKRLVAKLNRMTEHGHDAALALENSIVNGWQGVFEPKTDSRGDNHGAHNRRDHGRSVVDRNREGAERYLREHYGSVG